MSDIKRPDCFNFAMDFLGEPEAEIIEQYITKLEQQLTDKEEENTKLRKALEE